MILALVAVAAAANVSAADRGFYLGAGLGVPSYEVADFSPDFADLRFEEDGFGLKVFAGYQIFKYFGVEASYMDYGKTTLRETDINRVDLSVDVDIDSWDVSAVGFLPLGRKTKLFGKLGYASWNAGVKESTFDTRFPDEDPIVEDKSRDGTDITFGAGIDFLMKKFGIRVALDWLEMKDTSGAFMLSASLTYRF
jgi:OOP family OmpA-OmpF porin